MVATRPSTRSAAGAPEATREQRLGPDLWALLRDRGVRLAAVADVTTLPSPGLLARAFRLDLVDGTRLKARQMATADKADAVRRLLAAAGDGFPRVIAWRGSALLFAWFEGATLADPAGVAPATLRRCGALLAGLHTRAVPDGAILDTTGPADVCERLEREVDALARAGRLSDRLARRCLDAAAASAPGACAVGIVHGDFCGENIVGSPRGPVCVDNANLGVGPLDFDLARVFYRWRLAPAQRAELLAGYARVRDPAAFRSAALFWLTCAFIGGAAVRERMQVPGAEEALRRLDAMLHAERDALGSPEWT